MKKHISKPQKLHTSMKILHIKLHNLKENHLT